MWRLVTADGSSDKLCTATKVAKLATDSGTCTILRNTSTSLMTLALLNNFKHLYNSSLACPMGPSTIQCQTALSQSELSFWKLREGIDWVNLRHCKKKPPVAANSPERHTFCWTGSKLASLHYEARLLFSFERQPPAFFWGPVVWTVRWPFHSHNAQQNLARKLFRQISKHVGESDILF